MSVSRFWRLKPVDKYDLLVAARILRSHARLRPEVKRIVGFIDELVDEQNKIDVCWKSGGRHQTFSTKV